MEDKLETTESPGKVLLLYQGKTVAGTREVGWKRREADTQRMRSEAEPTPLAEELDVAGEEEKPRLMRRTRGFNNKVNGDTVHRDGEDWRKSRAAMNETNHLLCRKF